MKKSIRTSAIGHRSDSVGPSLRRYSRPQPVSELLGIDCHPPVLSDRRRCERASLSAGRLADTSGRSAVAYRWLASKAIVQLRGDPRPGLLLEVHVCRRFLCQDE